MSKVQSLKNLQNEMQKLQAQHDKLSKELEGVGAIAETARKEAEKRGIDLVEICYALVPDLDKRLGKGSSVAQPGEKKQRQARRLKTYKNPHTGEIIQTKGGNHKTLKSWREKHGDAVDTWGSYED